MRAFLAAALAAVATAQSYNAFTSTLQGYSGGGCNNGTQVFAVTMNGCTALPGGGFGTSECSFEDDKHASLKYCTDAACVNCAAVLSGVSESDKCYIATSPSLGVSNVRVRCSSTQTAAASSVVVGLAVTLSLSAVAMCAFWVYKDKRAHKAEAASGYSSV